MYRKQVRRRRAVLVSLVVLSLVLLSFTFGESGSGSLSSLQRGVASVFGPIEEGAGRALKPVRDLFNWFGETFDARGENERLQAEVTELREQVVGAEAALNENRELRRALRYTRRSDLDGYEPVTARVIARSPTVWYSQVTIDRGESAGLERQDPVVTGDGLVGRVTELTAGTAQVTMITDHRSAVSGRVLPDGPLGIVTPEVGNPDDLLLDFIEEDEAVREGKTIVTSGSTASQLESFYPYGIPIGEVVKAEAGEQEAYQRVHVKPFADLRDFEFVQVLTGGDGSGVE